MQIADSSIAAPRSLRRVVPIVVVGLAALLYSVFYLQTLNRWWYADDPLHMHYVLSIANPLAIFTEPAVLRNTGAGNALVPVQLLSYWIDAHLFGAHPLTAYSHNLLVFVATTVALYLVLWRWTRKLSLAMGATFLWMILPSTLAVHQYTSTRHYMEGILFALLLVLVVQRSVERDERFGWGALLLVTGLGLLSMLSKEIYATTVPVFLALMGWGRRRYSLIGIAVALTMVYATYRIAFLGTNLSYTMPLLGPRQFLDFLAVLPYTFAASPIGYLFYLGVAALGVVWLRRSWRMAVGPTVLCLALMAATLLAVYPVAEGLLLTYREPETWYRVPFLINTLLLIYGARALSREFERSTAMTVLALAIVLMLPNTEFTRLQWANTLARAEAEGKFYLAEPEKLLYSEEEALWFIVGVHRLYRVPQPHYIHKYFTSSREAKQLLRQHDTIWRYEAGTYIADAELYDKLVRMNGESRSTAGE